MKNMLIGEIVVIVLLIVIICVVPSGGSVSELEESSLKTEHVGRVNLSQSGNSSVTGNQDITGGLENSPDDGIEKTLVSISRPKGGFAAYENGTFVEPEPETEVELPDDGDDTSGDSDSEGAGIGDGTGNDSDDGTGEDGEPDVDDTGDDSEDDSEDNNSGDFDWDMKDPTKAIDSGKRATTTAPIKIRSTPTIQTEDNVMDTLSEGEVLIVTDAEVSSPDPDVPNWVEVYYEGQIGYISAKYVSVE
ncbi:MAG: SH3 domain-containing protein [Lachnospiraceae bacterium]|nr:SH3 domain-containing protein [Lachnospiraceae bacterium]